MSKSKRLFISIAVSKPDGNLTKLPGAITASERMANWAGAHGYIPLLINDEIFSEVTTELLRDEISKAIHEITERVVLHRIIIFFAGHGAALGIDDQTWMLSNWYKRPSEAVKLSSLQRMLEYYGPEQVTIIGDACQEYSKQFIDVLGNAILDRTNESPKGFELDRFFPVDAGNKAFMIKGDKGKEDSCLFTEVMLEALEGRASPDYFEKIDDGQHITSQTLAQYLIKVLPRRAGQYGLHMAPRPRPGFSTDRVYYSVPECNVPAYIKCNVPAYMSPPEGALFLRTKREDEIIIGVDEGKNDKNKIKIKETTSIIAVERKKKNRKRNLKETRDLQNEAYSRAAHKRFQNSFENGCSIYITGAEIGAVSPSRGTFSQDDPNFYRLKLNNDHNPLLSADVLVELADASIATACLVQNVITSMHVFKSGATNVLHEANAQQGTHHEIPQDVKMRSDMISLLDRLQAGSLTEKEIVDAAAMMRMHKHHFITIGAVAAQLYDSIRDIDSLHSIAAFYAQNEQPIPLDIVLFGGGRLYAKDDGLYANIPPTPKRKPRSKVEDERPFTWEAMGGIDRHPVAGRVPWMRQAWGAIETADCDNSAEEWRKLALSVLPHIGAGQFSRVRGEGRNALFALAGITDKREYPDNLDV